MVEAKKPFNCNPIAVFTCNSVSVLQHELISLIYRTRPFCVVKPFFGVYLYTIIPRTESGKKEKRYVTQVVIRKGRASRFFFPVLFSDGSRTRNPIRPSTPHRHHHRRRLGLRVRIPCGLNGVTGWARGLLCSGGHTSSSPYRPSV